MMNPTASTRTIRRDRPELSVTVAQDSLSQIGGIEATELLVVIRTPKSASTTLATLAAHACVGGRTFMLPNTLDLEGEISAFQRLRYARHAMRLNHRHHRLLRTADVYAAIDRDAKPGDLISGGHIDFDTCRRNLKQKVKMIALIRNPVDRSLSEYAYARAAFRRKRSWMKLSTSLLTRIAGRYSYEGYLDFLIEHGSLFGNIACKYLGIAPHASFEEHFAKHAYHFGTVDNLRAFAQSLGCKTGRNIPLDHLNRSSVPTDRVLTRATFAKLERLYATDFEVYEWCRKRENTTLARANKAPVPRLVTI
jgi:hypothetical protein